MSHYSSFLFKVEDLESNKRKFVQQNSELENTVKNAQRDTKKMQELRDTLQLQLEASNIHTS